MELDAYRKMASTEDRHWWSCGRRAIVRAVITLGHSLDIKVVAEGVETADQLTRMRAEGCDEVQGYYFGKPMPAADFVTLVRNQNAEARRA